MKTALFSRTTLVPLASCAVLLATSLPALAAQDYFLKIDGVAGESADKDHKGWINIDSFNWGIQSTASVLNGTGATVGKPVFSDFSWEQMLDSSALGLFQDISTGKHINNAVVDFTTSGEKSFTYFKMTFENVYLTDVSLSGTSGSTPLIEGSFAYNKVTLDYWTQKPDGSRGTHTSAFYDLATATGSTAAVASVFALGLIGPLADAAPIPEPESYAMLLAGLGLVGLIARKRKKFD
jgi:type VI secretion system secreted protein Hcp